MLELISLGLLLGWGAAIPIGAINLEIIRRNLNFGTQTGIALGLGACLADVTFLLLLSYGAMQLLNSPLLQKTTGIAGALVLAWFGWKALSQKSEFTQRLKKDEASVSYIKHTSDGYLLTLINPYGLIFWSSVSMTIAANTQFNNAIIYTGLGVILGVLSWILLLNIVLHFTRHVISNKVMNVINVIGGLILVTMAMCMVWRLLI